MSRILRRTNENATLAQILLQRLDFIATVVVSLALLIVGKIDDGFNQRAQAVIADVAVPAAEFIGKPIVWAGELSDLVNAYLVESEENARMQAENTRLRQLEPRLEQLINENERLRDLLALPSVTDSPVITARSVTYPGSPFLWTTLLDAGSDDGVQPYQPVIDHQGVIGRILSVGASSSRALLITDLNSRVPVMVLETGDHAILEGDNSRKPYLSFLEAAHKVEPGFQVVTSGDGGIFPPLLPIGVTEIEETGTLRVVPLADLARLEYVQIIQHKEPVAPEEFEAPEEPVATEEAPAVVSEGEEAAP